jgi:hypothetical protein
MAPLMLLVSAHGRKHMRCLMAIALAVSACATAQPAAIPANLVVPAGNAERFSTLARGTQNYTCQKKSDAAETYEWAFSGPEADLFDSAGNKIGTHFAGPTWQLNDGSKVVGSVKEKAPSPDSIAWLLLEAKSTEGQGKLTGVTFVQRLETEGGKPPAGGCDANHVGEIQKVAYRASYHFFASK